MFLRLLDFLNNQQYLESVEWADQVLRKPGLRLSNADKHILQYLSRKQFPELVEQLRKIVYSTAKNESYELLLNQFESNANVIRTQWQFGEYFQKDQPFLNIILKDNILIYQPQKSNETTQSLELLSDFEHLAQDPNILMIGGNLFELKGLSTIDKLQVILRDSDIQGEFSKFKKYEKMVNFIEALELPLQELFSLHQIGVIIFEEEIYLVKWIQYLDEDEVISKDAQKKPVLSLLENFGVNIGVQVNSNLELGNLVIFSKKESDDQNTQLRPLLSLDESIFQGTTNKKTYQKLDLSNEKDCQKFVDNVLARIETGIMLLNKEKSAFLQKPQDLDIYIKITLQKVDAIDSINQRINILRDLLTLNKNPDNLPSIRSKLENFYIIFLKQQFEFNTPKNIPGIVRTIAEMKLFQQGMSLLVHTLVYLFDINYADSETILSTVQNLESYWPLSKDLIQLLEKPEIIAITGNVIQLLDRGQFTEVLGYLTGFLKDHPTFRSYNIITLMVQILTKIFRQANQTPSQIFDNSKFLHFFSEFVKLINQYEKDLSEADYKSLRTILEDHFNLITSDVDFIAYLNNKLIEYFTSVETITLKILRKKVLTTIIHNFIQYAPLVMFQRNLYDVCWQTYELLINRKNDDEILQFFTQFVNIFTQSYEILKKNTQLLRQSVKILEGMKRYTQQTQLPRQFYLPLKTEILQLFNTWYLSGHLPESDFEIHKEIMQMWADFVEYRDKLELMMNILYMKDFIWSCYNNDLIEVKKKYKVLPALIFENYSVDLLEEFQTFFKIPYSLLGRFEVIHQLLRYLKSDSVNFQLTPGQFQQFISSFVDNIIKKLIEMIQDGDSNRFQGFIDELGEDILFLNIQNFEQLIESLTNIFQFKPSEGKCFLGRMEIIRNLSGKIQEFISNSYTYSHSDNEEILSETKILTSSQLEEIQELFEDSELKILQSAIQWLIKICEENYATLDLVFTPIKTLFLGIISHPSNNTPIILQEFSELIDNFFNNEKMLTDNKKYFYRIILEILPQEKYSEFYPRISDDKAFFDELTDLESTYYNNIKDRVRDLDKIISVMNRCYNLIQKNQNLFNPWFFYANCLTLQERYQQAIDAYKEAMKKRTTRGNLSRLIQNLIVCYMSTENLEDAIELVKNLDIGLKVYIQNSQTIRQLEDRTGEHFFA